MRHWVPAALQPFALWPSNPPKLVCRGEISAGHLSTAWRPVSCPQSGKSTSRNGPSAVFQGGEPQLGLLSVGARNNRRYPPARCSRACWPGAPGLPSLEIADGESLPWCLLECVLFIARATEYGKFRKHWSRTTAASVFG